MAKVSFKYYLQDSYDRDELEDFLMSDQELAPWDARAIAEKRPFYEVTLLCEYDTETGEVTVVRTVL